VFMPKMVRAPVGICVHAKDGKSASSLDGVFHRTDKQCWLCTAEEVLEQGCSIDRVLEKVPVDRGLEFLHSTSAEVKFHGGEKNQDMEIGQLLTDKKTCTKPAGDHIVFSTASTWNFEPCTLTGLKVEDLVVKSEDGRFQSALFKVINTGDSIEMINPLQMFEDRAGLQVYSVVTLKTPVVVDGVVQRHGCDYFMQCMWHMYTTSTAQCVFAARTNKEMFVQQLYWKDWEEYVMNTMVPKAHSYVEEVLMVDFAAVEVGNPRDILREPICDLVEEHRQFASQLASSKKALHECKGLVSKKQSNNDANTILQSLQEMMYEMSATERRVAANIVGAGMCADSYCVDLQLKFDTISTALANSTHLVEAFHITKKNFTVQVVECHRTVQVLSDRSLIPTSASSNDATVSGQFLSPMVAPVTDVHRQEFKIKYKNLDEAKKDLTEKLKVNGWGRGGNQGCLPKNKDQWIAAYVLLTHRLTHDGDQP